MSKPHRGLNSETAKSAFRGLSYTVLLTGLGDFSPWLSSCDGGLAHGGDAARELVCGIDRGP